MTSGGSVTATAPPPVTRLHGLDALRGGALLLGIVIHSLLPFTTLELWLVNDRATSPLADLGIYVIHLFRMTLFMLLAGYFARMSLHRKGAAAFTTDRLRRIALPLVVFWPIAVLPLGLLAVAGAAWRGVPLATMYTSGDAAPPVLPPGQLWFLVVLLQCYVIMLVARAALRLVGGAQRGTVLAERAGAVLSSPAGVLLAAAPFALGVLIQGEPVTGGILEPQTFLPEPRALVPYFGAFAVGWALHARPDALHRLSRGRWVHLAVAIVATAAGQVLTGGQILDSTQPAAVVAPVVAVAGWTWSYALLGLCVRHLTRERPALRYLADSSYWIYLLHLPLLVVLQILLADLDWPILAKLGLTWLVSGTLLVLSYHVLVRSTWIGKWLNGRRHPWTWPPFTGQPRRPVHTAG